LTERSTRHRLSGETCGGVEVRSGPERGGEPIGTCVNGVGQLVVEVGEADFGVGEATIGAVVAE